MTELIDAWAAASDNMRAAFREAQAERDAARSELADLRRQVDAAQRTFARDGVEMIDLRRQLAEAQCTASSERARRIDKSNVAEYWQREHGKIAAELADLRRQLAEAQATMADMRRAEYARVREEFPPGRTAIIPPDVSGSMTVAPAADAYPPTETPHQ